MLFGTMLTFFGRYQLNRSRPVHMSNHMIHIDFGLLLGRRIPGRWRWTLQCRRWGQNRWWYCWRRRRCGLLKTFARWWGWRLLGEAMGTKFGLIRLDCGRLFVITAYFYRYRGLSIGYGYRFGLLYIGFAIFSFLFGGCGRWH